MPGRGVVALLAVVSLAGCSRAGEAAVPSPLDARAAAAVPTSTTSRPATSTSTTTTSTPPTTSTTTTTTVVTTTTPPPPPRAAPATAPPPPPATEAPEPPPADPPAPAPAPDPPAVAPRVFAVGDSVMLRAADSLAGLDVTVDASVGRQWSAGIPIVRDAVAAGATTVVIHLGTNGPVSEAQFEQMMAAAGGARVVVVTVQLPDDRYPHEAPTNDVLRAGAARHGAALVDWNEATNGHPELLRPDGYHMDPTAVPLYVSLVAAAL